MEKILKIVPPIMPNFFQYEIPPKLKQDGINFNHHIPIAELSEEEAIEFGEMMKREFIKHWENKKQQP